MSRDRVFIDAPDGARLFVRLLGDAEASASPILILDGIGCAGWAFRRLAPLLARDRRVALAHYRGHGRSPTPPRPWNVGPAQLADDAELVCEQLGLGACTVVGFSMGFQVALELYRRHPDRVRSLVSVAGPAGKVLDTFYGTGALGTAIPAIAGSARLARDTWRSLWVKSLPSELPVSLSFLTGQVNKKRLNKGDLQIYMRQLALVNPELFLGILERAHRHDAYDLLPRVAVPSLIIAGANDSFVPVPVLRKIAFMIPNAQWQHVPDASHALPAEFPDELAARIGAFAREV